MADQLEEIIVAMGQLHASEVQVLQQARRARESVAEQAEKLRRKIAASGDQLTRSVDEWEEENLTKLRERQLDMFKCLSASTSAGDVKKRWAVAPDEDLLVTFLPSPPGAVHPVGTLNFKQLKDDVPASVCQLKEQMEKELDCKVKNLKRKHTAVPNTSKQEQGAVGDSTGGESDSAKHTKENGIGGNLEEKTKKPEKELGVDRVEKARQKNNQHAKESLKFQDAIAAPQQAIRPPWAIEGSCCLARSDKDGFWYEAQILRHQSTNLCMVLFVSNGDHAVIGPDDLVKEVKDLGVEQLLEPAMRNDAAKRREKEEMKQLKSSSLKLGESNAVQSKAKIHSKGQDSVETWKSGSVCIAKWTDDGVWYRAEVLEALEGNCYTVCFLDYGNTATTTSDDMVSSRNKVPEGQIIDDYVCMPKDREEGSTCLALYKEEMIWCRALLVEKTKGGWEVEFMDYGGERAEVEEGDLVDSINEVPLGQNVDSAVLNCVDIEIGQLKVVDEVEVKRDGLSDNERQVEKTKELSSEGEDGYVTMASHCNQAYVDEEVGEPSMEMETVPSKSLVPMPASGANSSEPATPNTGNPVLLLQPEDMCLAVWDEDGVLYNAQLLDWQPGYTGADVLFVDYENVERVELKDIYTRFSDVPGYMADQGLVDINVETGIVASAPPPSIEPTSPALRLKLDWSVDISWSPQHSTRLAIFPNGKVVVALPHKHNVLLFNKEGKAKGTMGTFENPCGVTTMVGGNMAVLDNKRIVIFSKSSGKPEEIAPNGFSSTAGLCADHEGALVTINRCGLEEREKTITEPGKTDLLFIDKKSGKIEKRLEMEDIIDEGSSCTLLVSCAGRYHVGDQGLNQVYTLYMEEGELQATVCGSPEQWAEVSSIAGMIDGGLLVLDAITQRILRLSATGELMGHAEVDGELLEAVSIAAWEKRLVIASKGTLAMYRMEEL